MAADGDVGDAELARDFACVLALAEPFEYLELTDRQLDRAAHHDQSWDRSTSTVSILADQARGHLTRQRGLAVDHPPDRVRKSVDGCAGQEIPIRTRTQRPEQILVALGTGQHDDLRLRQRVPDLLGRLDAATREMDRQEADIRPEPECLGDRGPGRRHLGDDLEIGASSAIRTPIRVGASSSASSIVNAPASRCSIVVMTFFQLPSVVVALLLHQIGRATGFLEALWTLVVQS